MILLQFLIELVALFLLFIIFRAGVLKAFPVKAIGMSLSADSQKALKKFRNRYIALFILIGGLCSLLIWYLLVFFISQYHASTNEIVLVVEDFAVVLPSIILGFLAGTFLARGLNHVLQKDGLSFFFEDFTDELEGFDRNSLQLWQILVGLVMAAILIAAEFNQYIKASDVEIVVKIGLFENEQQFAFSEAKIIELKKQPKIFGLITGDDTLSLSSFSGDKIGFMQKIKANNSK